MTIGTINIILSKQSRLSDKQWGLSSAGRASAYKQRVIGSSPIGPFKTKYGGIAQLARAYGSYP